MTGHKKVSRYIKYSRPWPDKSMRFEKVPVLLVVMVALFGGVGRYAEYIKPY